MDAEKITATFIIESDQRTWLEDMAKAHDLDLDKALRVVLDFAKQDGDEDTIFNTVRCHHC